MHLLTISSSITILKISFLHLNPDIDNISNRRFVFSSKDLTMVVKLILQRFIKERELSKLSSDEKLFHIDLDNEESVPSRSSSYHHIILYTLCYFVTLQVVTLQSTPKEGLEVSPAEMVFGEAIAVSGEFFHPITGFKRRLQPR
ncbi:Uncharacterised protein at_DN0935 [Pycnogonum litorale]